MTEHILGVHWIPAHNRDSDLEYMRRLQPSSVKIIDPDVSQIARVYAAAPNALIVLRNHPRSEQHDDVRRDPEGTGTRHADEWARDLVEYSRKAAERGLTLPPADKLIVLGINEPHVWDALDQTVRYNVAFLRRCTEHGIRAGALNLSVGWPANTGTDTPPNWTPYAPIEAEIKRGKHYLFLHEYHDSRGVLHNWLWWCGRFVRCPWDVPIIIGECGLDQYVSDASVAKERRGWMGWYSVSEYVAQLHLYAQRCADDGRIVSIQPFTTDSADTWQSFETQPAHGEILARQWPIPKRKSTVHIPTVTVSKRMYVTATVLNVRERPGVSADNPAVERLHNGDAVTVQAKADVNGETWYSVGDNRWVHGAWLSETQPEPSKPVEPQPTQTGIIDPRTATAILQVESGGQGFGPGGRLLIRFENHLFNEHTGNRYANLFAVGNPQWTGHRWRRSESDAWQTQHNNQAEEWAAFEFASTLNRNAALLSISMGAPQILGSNHRRIGYASAEAMFSAFGNRQYGLAAQMVGFTNFCLSSAELMQAIAERDFATVARLYNGGGQVAHYTGLMQAAYDRLGSAI